jgi:spectrin beta
MILIQKTNNDWWSVRKANGQEGYVPANYMKEINPKVIKKVIKKTVNVPQKVMVTKTGYRKEIRPIKKKKSSKVRRTPSGE